MVTSAFYLPGCSLWFCCFSIENLKTGGVLFFFFPPSDECFMKSRWLLRTVLLFLFGSGISLAYLPLHFFPPVETPEETAHCFLPATVCGDFSPHFLRISRLLLSHCHMQQGAVQFKKDHGHCLGPPLASCLPGIWQDRKLPSVVSAHANYLRKSSTQVLYPAI